MMSEQQLQRWLVEWLHRNLFVTIDDTAISLPCWIRYAYDDTTAMNEVFMFNIHDLARDLYYATKL